VNLGAPALGIDIGGSSVKVAALEGDRVLAVGQSARYQRPDRRELEDAIAGAIATLGSDAIARFGTVAAVGLCAPGILDESRNVIVRAINVPGIMDVPLSELLTSACQRVMSGIKPSASSLVVMGDALAAAMDVFHVRRLEGRVLALSIGTGVGAAVLDDGLPLRVAREVLSPGHLGQLDVTLDEHDVLTPVGPDGGRGGLEGYIGLPALITRYGASALNARLADGLGPSEPPVRALARAVRIAHAIYRPNHVVLLGGTGVRLLPSLPAVRTLVDDRLTGLARLGWTLGCGDSDFHAALGVARSARDRLKIEADSRTRRNA
jgi:glucokinase